MGRLSEWAEKNKAGSTEQLAKKAERAQKRDDLKADFAATRVGFADTKAEMAAANVKLKEKEAAQVERDADASARAATKRDAHLARLDVKTAKGESFEGVTLTSDRISYKGQGGLVFGASAHVETAADARRRVTATRVLALGVFALAAKKQTGNVYLTVQHPDFEFVVEVPVKKETKAREFAAKINNAAKR